mmetsp:Transcript_66571/g.143600  ORF Transcript_66571/g.143600 Transcript_66571/m.143600 type:complete len:263 (-) Transcript_66571:8-796(-)
MHKQTSDFNYHNSNTKIDNDQIKSSVKQLNECIGEHLNQTNQSKFEEIKTDLIDTKIGIIDNMKINFDSTIKNIESKLDQINVENQSDKEEIMTRVNYINKKMESFCYNQNTESKLINQILERLSKGDSHESMNKNDTLKQFETLNVNFSKTLNKINNKNDTIDMSINNIYSKIDMTHSNIEFLKEYLATKLNLFPISNQKADANQRNNPIENNQSTSTEVTLPQANRLALTDITALTTDRQPDQIHEQPTSANKNKNKNKK